MTTPANAIKDEVRVLVDVQIETFRQPAGLTASQLHGYRSRAEKIKMLWQELDRIGIRSVVERRWGSSQQGGWLFSLNLAKELFACHIERKARGTS